MSKIALCFFICELFVASFVSKLILTISVPMVYGRRYISAKSRFEVWISCQVASGLSLSHIAEEPSSHSVLVGCSRGWILFLQVIKVLGLVHLFSFNIPIVLDLECSHSVDSHTAISLLSLNSPGI